MPSSAPIIDLNADLGEGGLHDCKLMQLISSANIACGGHAGNTSTMQATVDAALSAGVAIGAHPGYEDPEHFGRRSLALSPSEIHSMVCRQIEQLLQIHPHIHHVKPHGALYHQANQDPLLAKAFLEAILALTPSSFLYAPPQGELAQAATTLGIPHCAEGFIDRRYLPNGTLCPRTETGAIIQDAPSAIAQSLHISQQQSVLLPSGETIPLPARTLCIHGDSPNAVTLLSQCRSALIEANVSISAP